LISLVLLVLSVQADDFKGQKVTLGKRKCTCDFRLDMKEACKGTAKCDKKCSGAGKVEVGGCSFVLQVKKGAGKISKCACDAAQPTIGPVTGSGSGPEPRLALDLVHHHLSVQVQENSLYLYLDQDQDHSLQQEERACSVVASVTAHKELENAIVIAAAQ